MAARRRSTFSGLLADRVGTKVESPTASREPERAALKQEVFKNAPKALWQIVGGERTGGLIVRMSVELGSEVVKGRLATGSVVEQIHLEGDRLQYFRLTGSGPNQGWITTTLSEKVLAEPISKMPDIFSISAVNASSSFGQWGNCKLDTASNDVTAPEISAPAVESNSAASQYGIDCAQGGVDETQQSPRHPSMASSARVARPGRFSQNLKVQTAAEESAAITTELVTKEVRSQQQQQQQRLSLNLQVQAVCQEEAFSTEFDSQQLKLALNLQDQPVCQEEADTTAGSSTRSQKPHDIELEYSFQLPTCSESTLNELADATAKQAGISVLRRLSQGLTPRRAAEPVPVFSFSPPSSPHGSQQDSDVDEYDFESFNARVQEDRSAETPIAPCFSLASPPSSPRHASPDVFIASEKAESVSPTRSRRRGGA